ncbi:MAG TPA: archaeosortase/exosortase family protein [Opitutaceae bacterium]|nr:archaeosortase/exosortase family protein [Opitutaceae bacterium]
MKRDFIFAATLAGFGVFIWCRDLRWLANADDILPIAAGIPVFIWMLWPLRRATPVVPVRLPVILVAAALFAVGTALNSNLVLAVSWSTLLYAWLAARLAAARRTELKRLLVLPLFSFPWIATDFTELGWLFRLSGAAAVEQTIGALGIAVARAGTFLTVNGFALSVEPACSGLNGLQALIMGGTMVAFLHLGAHRHYWLGLLAIPLAAWAANYFRILSGAAVASSLSPEAAARWIGPLHSAAGWVALGAMLGACWYFFAALARQKSPALENQFAPVGGVRWLELGLIGYATWRCLDLGASWFTSPFDHLGWLAFAFWILPLGVTPGEGIVALGADRRRLWIVGAAVVLLCGGQVASVNAVEHVGLALLVIGLAPRDFSGAWYAGALAWMPATGWLASRLGISPEPFGLLRTLLGVAACAWVLRPQGPRQISHPAYAVHHV